VDTAHPGTDHRFKFGLCMLRDPDLAVWQWGIVLCGPAGTPPMPWRELSQGAGAIVTVAARDSPLTLRGRGPAPRVDVTISDGTGTVARRCHRRWPMPL
jgi:hypothetical protein